MKRVVIHQIAWFAGIGVINTMVDFVVLNGLLWIFGISSAMGYGMIKAVSFLAGNANSYLLNTRFTFPAARTITSFGTFLAATLVGLGVNVFVAWQMFQVLTPAMNEWWAANAAAVIATLASMIVNFLLYKYVVFRTSLSVVQEN